MLPESHQQPYQVFRRAIAQLLAIATRSQIDGVALRTEFLQAQQLFQTQLMGLSGDGLTPAADSLVRSYLTEINKQLRLLGVDVMYLQAARQSMTTQKRQAQMGDRLRTLLRYCDTLLEPPPDENRP